MNWPGDKSSREREEANTAAEKGSSGDPLGGLTEKIAELEASLAGMRHEQSQLASKLLSAEDGYSSGSGQPDDGARWQATDRADARTRARALSTSLENSVAQLGGTKTALARAEEQNQRLQDALSDTRMLIERLNRRVEALTREKAESASANQKDVARLSQQLEDALGLAHEEKWARAEAENARNRLDELRSVAETDKGLLNAHIAWLQERLDKEAESAKGAENAFQDSRRALEAILRAQAESLALAEKRIRHFIRDRASWRNRFGELLGLRRSGAYRQLADWRPQITFDQKFTSTLQSSHSSVQAYPMLFHAAPAERNPYHRADSLPELLSWDDVDFVRCAYVTVMGRQPEPEGEEVFTRFIRRGGSKQDLLWRLRNSPEGRRHDPGIAGFDRALKRAAWGRTPVVGPIVRLFTRTEGDTVADRRHRRLLNQIAVLRNEQRAQRQLLGFLLDRVAHSPVPAGVAEGEEPSEEGDQNGASDSARAIERLGSRERYALEMVERFAWLLP